MKAVKIEAGEASKVSPPPAINRGISILDLVLRIVAVGGTLGRAVGIATTEEQLPFSTQFLMFSAQYNDFPTSSFFLIVNAIACAYFALSIPLSILHIARSRAKNSRVVLIFMDTVMLGLLTSAASAAAAIIYLAHSGNASANWLAICQQYNNFCQQSSGSLIGSFGGVVILVVLIVMSATALSRH